MLPNRASRAWRSGSQKGSDIDSDLATHWFAVVECKRYRGDTGLDQRELVAEIQIATGEDSQIDLLRKSLNQPPSKA